MPQLWICYYTATSGDKPIGCAEVATGITWINWSYWVELNKGQYPRLADLGNRMKADQPFEPIEDELRLLITTSFMPAELKLVARALLIGVLGRPDDTTSIVIMEGKECGDKNEKNEAV